VPAFQTAELQNRARIAKSLGDCSMRASFADSLPGSELPKGISQTELARRLGVSKQVTSRYEESDYQTMGVARLQEVLDAIGIKTMVRLSP
jgi:predicted transcriptional regulator